MSLFMICSVLNFNADDVTSTSLVTAQQIVSSVFIYWTLPVAQHIKGQFSQSQISDIDYVTTDKSWGKLWPRPLLRIYKYIYIYIIYIYIYIYNLHKLRKTTWDACIFLAGCTLLKYISPSL